jgi:hypothetical protein
VAYVTLKCDENLFFYISLEWHNIKDFAECRIFVLKNVGFFQVSIVKVYLMDSNGMWQQ